MPVFRKTVEDSSIEKGFLGNAFYNMGLMESWDGEAAEELGYWFGVSAAYTLNFLK